LLPTTSANAALGVSAFINAAEGLRADFFLAAFLGAAFLATFFTAFLAAGFFTAFFATYLAAFFVAIFLDLEC
jgi:hypothetical protein